MSLRTTYSELTRRQKWTLYTSAAVVVYAIIGFLIAPPIIRSQAETSLAEQLGRRVTIGKVAVNPFALSLTVRDFEVYEADLTPFFEFDELYVNMQLSSIYHRAYAMSEVRLEAPFVHIQVLKDGSLNFADILDRLATEDEDAQAGPPPLLVFLAKVSEGRILFSDDSHDTLFEHEISPLDVELHDFGTRPDDESPYSFSATTGAGEALQWEGNLSVVPLYANGEFALTGIKPRTGWLYFQDDLTFEVVDGSVDFRGRFEMDAREGLIARLAEGIIEFRDIAIAERESGQRAVEIPEFDIEGISLRYPEQSLRVARVSSIGGRYHVQRMVDGRFRLERFLENRREDPNAAATEANVAEEAGTSADEAGGDWEVAVDQIEISGFRVEFEDLSTAEPVLLTLDPIRLGISELTNQAGRAARIDLDITLDETGRVNVGGRVGADPPLAELDLSFSDIDLRLLEPYWSERVAMQMESGLFALTGHAVAKDLGLASENIAFDGGLAITRLSTSAEADGEALLAWTAVELEGLSINVTHPSVRLRKLALEEPSARIGIDPDGASNLDRILIVSPEGAPDAKPNEDGGVSESSTDIPIRIDVVEIQNASARFVDRSVAPSFSSGLTDFGGRIDGLSSDPASRSKLNLEGKLNGATPMRVTGIVSPLAADPYADVQIHFANFELTPFTPYSGRYIGRAIKRGKLFVDLDYELNGDVLAGENKIFLDQFTLGDDVDSADAVNLPVDLAIGLLKDRKGEIHIDLPVRGDVDDPEFSIGRLIAGALGQLITKVALSPFSMMGGLVGQDGEAMRFVTFAPGSAMMPQPEQAKLDALASALAERPGLSLELSGAASPNLDRPAMQAAAVNAQIRQARFAELRRQVSGDKSERVDDVVMTEEDSNRLLRAVYEDQFGEDPETLLAPTPPDAKDIEEVEALRDQRTLAAARERMEAATVVEDSALRELAMRRARLIRDTLVADDRVAAERVFLLEPTVADQSEGDGARSQLSLAAH